ncbi:ATP-binding protein [Thiomicrorhabdus sp. Kp2]|uniref:ATP-binding protein n=1 Tax=Thiomicrorhabdus sp. Kp2 TaxID=1123518 RepID=UPI00041B61A6|nr:ATP-binding protein [Thiomicrorhabdus sp. Kp2]
MGIRLKLITLLLLFGFIVLGALLWSNQFVLHKTMLHYIDQRDQQRLERLQSNLDFYLQHEPVTTAEQIPEVIWLRMLRLSHRVDLQENPLPIEFVLKKESKKRKRSFPSDEFENRVSLIGDNELIIFGTTLEKTNIRLPIYQDNRIIGQIGYHPLKELIEKTDIEFAENQFKLLSLGALFITLLALLIIWPLANHLIAPIRQITESMRQLTSGDFSHRLNIQRKDEFGALQRDVNHLAKTLEASQLSRNQWIADISHELRTPLTVLNGSIEAMRDGIRPMNEKNLEQLHQEVGLLQRLIEDLYQLSLSDVGALQYAMQRLDFSQLLRQTAAQFENKAQQKGLALQITKFENKAWIQGDSERLQQMLNNLLQNAIDYTDAVQADGSKGTVQLSLMQSNQAWLLCIEDSSPAVTQEELTHLKERFFRAEVSRNRRTGGTGLGLAMVSQVIEAHEGEFTIELSKLGGLKVCIFLPSDNSKGG